MGCDGGRRCLQAPADGDGCTCPTLLAHRSARILPAGWYGWVGGVGGWVGGWGGGEGGGTARGALTCVTPPVCPSSTHSISRLRASYRAATPL